MANVAFFDDYGGPGTSSARLVVPGGNTVLYLGGQFYMTSAQLASAVGFSPGSLVYMLGNDSSHNDGTDLNADGSMAGFVDYAAAAGSFTPDAWHTVEMLWDMANGDVQMAIDGVSGIDHYGPFLTDTFAEIDIGLVAGNNETGQGIYVGNVWVGTGTAPHSILQEDWSSGDFSNWTAALGTATVISSPVGDPPAFSPTLTPIDPTVSPTTGRVLIAWDDGPLEPSPTWTPIDQGGVHGGATIPYDFVAGYDTHVGRQTLISQTDTGTASVYINDRSGLLDDRNSSSPWQGKLSGRQIMLQLYNPVTAAWEIQFRGLIDDYTYAIDETATDANGDPINASVQIDCVDLFDYLNGYGLTPGLDGVTPPAGAEDGVYYAATAGTVDDRIIEILTDVGVDPTMYIVASGNVHVRAVKYDPDESALTALRDAVDAELPFIGNCYVNRFGQYVFRGRYSRFDPDAVAAEPGSEWDFARWKVGDSKAISGDSSRAQMKVLSYSRDRNELINAAIAYPQNIAPKDMPNQVYANTSSITSYGKHAAAPMSDLLTSAGITRVSGGSTYTANDANDETALYAQLLVKNKKDPRVSITALQLKSIQGTDARSSATWDVLTKADISHIVNVKVGYPGGTGFTGGATQDDYYIEGRALTVRPSGATFDYVELSLEVSPAIWSMDTHNVFPPF